MRVKGNLNNFKASLKTNDTSVKSSLKAKITRETINPKIAATRATKQPATQPMALCSKVRCPILSWTGLSFNLSSPPQHMNQESNPRTIVIKVGTF